MHEAVYQDLLLKDKLNKCSNLNDVCMLPAENANYTNLLKESCDPAIELLKDCFGSLSLKENKIKTMNTVLDNDVKKFLENVNLDTELTGKETLGLLKDCSKLKTYLSHCSIARMYFFH